VLHESLFGDVVARAGFDGVMDPLKDSAREQAVERRAVAYRAVSATAATDLADGFVRYFKPGRNMTLSGYYPAAHEFDVTPLLERLHASGCAIGLPAAAAYGAPVEFHRWAPGDALVAGPYGRMQPSLEAQTLMPAMLLVPLLAFDSKCNPLTEGHGLYHQMVSALPKLSQRERSITIGIAFAGQQIDAVPMRVLDRPVNYVATETGIMRAPPDNTPGDAESWVWAVLGGPI
jgi:5-formyltetrahydrofolate cyclo-ligase